MSDQSTKKTDDLLPEKIRVLHIDDEEDFLYLTKEFVEKMSEGEIEVVSLRDPSLVIEKLRSNQIDVIVCDYLMEDLNGLDLLKTIKKEELSIPFIIFTGRGREEVVIDALNLGADYYIRKGSDARSQYAELVHQIRTVLRHKKAEEALVKRELELKEERDLTQLYLSKANVMFVILNADENVELMNKEVTNVLGYTEKDLIGNNWFTTVYSSEIVDEIRFGFQQVIIGMRKQTPYSEVEILTKSGEKRLIAWHNTEIMDENGKVVRLLGVGNDITRRKEIERALQESEEKYRILVETSPYSIVQSDLKGNITYANQQAAIMHGVNSPEELIGCSLMEFTAPEDHEKVMERLRKQLFVSLKGTFEYTMLKKDGTSFPAELNSSVLLGEDGKPIGLVAIGSDLSSRKDAERAIKESEKKYRGFVQNFAGIAFQASVDFKPFFFHGAVEKITGYHEEDFVEGDLTWDQLVLPEDIEQLLSIRQELETTQGFSNIMEYRIKHKNGEIKWIKQHIQNIGSTDNDEFVVQGSLYDITEEKLMEEELRERENTFQSLFEGIPDAVFIADKVTTEIVDCNKQAEKLLERSREEILSLKVADLHPEELFETARIAFEKHAQGHKELISSVILTKSNRRVVVSINASLITIKGKEFLQASFRDITEIRNKEEQLIRTESRYKILIDTSPDGIVMTDLNGKVTFANLPVANLLGLNEVDELIGLHFSQFVTEEDLERANNNSEKVLNEGVLRNQEYKLQTKDCSSSFFADVNVSRIDDYAGNPIAFMSVVRDISERKKADSRLRESETLYRTIFENTGTANLIVSEDKTIKLVNTKFTELTGFSKEDIEMKLKWPQILLEEDSRKLSELQELHFQDSKLAPESFEVRFKDGANCIRNAYLTVKTIPGTTDFIVTMNDITPIKTAEEKLKESENMYRTLFEATGTANAIARKDTIIEVINDKLRELSGYTKEEIENKMSWTSFVSESDLERLKEFNVMRMQDPSSVPERYEANLKDKEGNIVPCLLHIGVIPNTDKFIISIIDISETKKAEEELLKTVDLYRTIFESTGTANIIMGPNRIIKQVNSKVEEMTGFSPDQIVGQNWSQFVPEEAMENLIKFSRSTGSQTDIVPSYIETRFRNKTGSIRDVIVNLNAIPNSEDYTVAFFDITDMKDAEEETRKSENLYRTVFENTGMANIIFDSQYNIILVNSKMEEMSGYRREELEGKKWSEFIPQPELEMMLEYNLARMRDPSAVPSQYETRFIDKKGNINNILIAVVPIPESTDFIATVVDISERKKTMDTLTKQKKELSDFAHLMAHDIRNCLSSIEGYIDLVQEDTLEKGDYLNKMDKQVEYMRKLLDRSIELADAGQTVEKSDTVNLNEMVSSIATMIIPTDVEFSTESLFSVRADKEKLSQIIKNIFENAVIHGQPRMIQIKKLEREHSTVLRIINDGKLINKETINDAFESTFTTKEKENIHGLTIVKKLIEAHNWDIILCEVTEKPCFDISIPKEDIINE